MAKKVKLSKERIGEITESTIKQVQEEITKREEERIANKVKELLRRIKDQNGIACRLQEESNKHLSRASQLQDLLDQVKAGNVDALDELDKVGVKTVDLAQVAPEMLYGFPFGPRRFKPF